MIGPILGPVPARRVHRRRVGRAALLTGPIVLLAAACVRPAAPSPAVIRESPPPWAAPRDGISYITAAGLQSEPYLVGGQLRSVRLGVWIDDRPVQVPAGIGIDRLRAVQAAAHTHDPTGTVSLEGAGAGEVNLGQFFTLWGVRLDRSCLGSACGGVRVRVDGVPRPGDPREVPLGSARDVWVSAGR
jgi:hypothetical protein